MSAAIVTQKFSIDSADETFILVGTGAPTGGLVPGAGLPGVYAATPGNSSLFIQRDGSSGNQLWILTSGTWTAVGSGGGGSGVSSFNTRTGAVVPASNDYTFAQLASTPTTIAGYGITDIATTYAPLASPALTGTPTVPTASANTNTTQAASTAFVVGQVGTATPLINGTAAVGTSLLYARQDHVHPTDTSRSALASPTFTGTPAAPTATVGTNTTQLATTAFTLANPYVNAQSATLSTGTTVTLTAADGGVKVYTCTSATTVKLPANGSAPSSNAPCLSVTIVSLAASTANITVQTSAAGTITNGVLAPGMATTFFDVGSWVLL